MSATYQIKKSTNGTWYFNLKAGNNRLTRHKYNSLEGARKGIIAELKAVLQAMDVPITEELLSKIEHTANTTVDQY